MLGSGCGQSDHSVTAQASSCSPFAAIAPNLTKNAHCLHASRRSEEAKGSALVLNTQQTACRAYALRPPLSSLPAAPRPLPKSPLSIRKTPTCDIPTCNMRTCNMPTCNMQHACAYMQHAHAYMQHATCNMPTWTCLHPEVPLGRS
eukprot:332980-Chlamydomonas_euryale.AAC.1